MSAYASLVPPGMEPLGLLGTGAFADVVSARTGEGKLVAVKVLRVDRPAARRMFAREIKALRSMPDVPHLVGYIDHGTLRSGRPYIVMEHIAGYTLKALIDTLRERRGPGSALVAPADACALAAQLCRGLQFMHVVGVVHGDIKPANAIVSDQDCEAKLLDLGLVHDSGGFLRGLETSSLLAGHDFECESVLSGGLFGTPEYMAPELLVAARTRSARTIGPPVDVFAVATLIYELIVGAPPAPLYLPNGPRKRIRRALLAYLERRRDAVFDRPDLIPERLWEVLGAALSPDPAERPRDAGCLGQALDACGRDLGWTTHRPLAARRALQVDSDFRDIRLLADGSQATLQVGIDEGDTLSLTPPVPPRPLLSTGAALLGMAAAAAAVLLAVL